MKNRIKTITRLIVFQFLLLFLQSCSNNKKNNVNSFIEEYINTVSSEHAKYKSNITEKMKNYYEGIQAIMNKSYADDSKPCNRTVTNYCKNITDSYCGYIASPGYISYDSDNDITDIMNILRYN